MGSNANNYLVPALGPGEECQSLEELVAKLDGLQGEKLREEAHRHVAVCAHCQAEVAMFREFDSAPVEADEQSHIQAIVDKLRKKSPVPRKPWWSKFLETRAWAPAVAMVAAALVLAVYVPRSHEAKPELTSDMGKLRDVRIKVLSPAGDLTVVPSELRWNAFAGAASYRVKVSEVDQTELWQTTVETPFAQLPKEVSGKIAPLKTLRWQVEAVDAKGSPVAQSGIQTFRLLRTR